MRQKPGIDETSEETWGRNLNKYTTEASMIGIKSGKIILKHINEQHTRCKIWDCPRGPAIPK